MRILSDCALENVRANESEKGMAGIFYNCQKTFEKREWMTTNESKFESLR